MRKTALVAFQAAMLLCAAVSFAADSGLGKAETQGFEAVAKAYSSLASWCKTQKLPEKGMEAVEAGLKLKPDDKALAKLKEELAALGGEDSAEGLKKYESEKEKTWKKIAVLYQKLYLVKPAKDVPSRFYDYMAESIRFAPEDKGVWTGYFAALTEALSGKEHVGFSRLAGAALKAGIPKAFDPKLTSILETAAKKSPLLLKASDHPIEYYISLPDSYSAAKKFHILVTCEGAGSGFLGNHNGFRDRRGDAPVIIITPWTLSTTNTLEPKNYNYPQEIIDKYQSGPRIVFDEEGIICILKDVKARFSCNEKFFITGFSGGGNPTYLFVFKHPEMLAGAVPCCGNFSGQGIKDKPQEGTDVHVRILTGADDPHRQWTHGQVGSPGIEPQTDAAEKLLKEWGYSKFERIMLPGVGHSPLPEKVIEFIKEKSK